MGSLQKKSKKIADKAARKAYRDYFWASILFSVAKKRKEEAEKVLKMHQNIRNAFKSSS
jgi:hypothetical protein